MANERWNIRGIILSFIIEIINQQWNLQMFFLKKKYTSVTQSLEVLLFAGSSFRYVFHSSVHLIFY